MGVDRHIQRQHGARSVVNECHRPSHPSLGKDMIFDSGIDFTGV